MGFFSRLIQGVPALPEGDATVFRLAGRPPEYAGPHQLRSGPGYLHGCPILQQWTLSSADAAPVRTLLQRWKTYGNRGLGARCYTPGLAFRFGPDTPAAVEVLICLRCRWVAFHPAGRRTALVPSESGLADLHKVYDTLMSSISPSGS